MGKFIAEVVRNLPRIIKPLFNASQRFVKVARVNAKLFGRNTKLGRIMVKAVNSPLGKFVSANAKQGVGNYIQAKVFSALTSIGSRSSSAYRSSKFSATSSSGSKIPGMSTLNKINESMGTGLKRSSSLSNSKVANYKKESFRDRRAVDKYIKTVSQKNFTLGDTIKYASTVDSITDESLKKLRNIRVSDSIKTKKIQRPLDKLPNIDARTSKEIKELAAYNKQLSEATLASVYGMASSINENAALNAKDVYELTSQVSKEGVYKLGEFNAEVFKKVQSNLVDLETKSFQKSIEAELKTSDDTNKKLDAIHDYSVDSTDGLRKQIYAFSEASLATDAQMLELREEDRVREYKENKGINLATIMGAIGQQTEMISSMSKTPSEIQKNLGDVGQEAVKILGEKLGETAATVKLAWDAMYNKLFKKLPPGLSTIFDGIDSMMKSLLGNVIGVPDLFDDDTDFSITEGDPNSTDIASPATPEQIAAGKKFFKDKTVDKSVTESKNWFTGKAEFKVNPTGGKKSYSIGIDEIESSDKYKKSGFSAGDTSDEAVRLRKEIAYEMAENRQNADFKKVISGGGRAQDIQNKMLMEGQSQDMVDVWRKFSDDPERAVANFEAQAKELDAKGYVQGSMYNLHPDLRGRMLQFMSELSSAGIPYEVTSVLRSQEAADKLSEGIGSKTSPHIWGGAVDLAVKRTMNGVDRLEWVRNNLNMGDVNNPGGYSPTLTVKDFKTLIDPKTRGKNGEPVPAETRAYAMQVLEANKIASQNGLAVGYNRSSDDNKDLVHYRLNDKDHARIKAEVQGVTEGGNAEMIEANALKDTMTPEAKKQLDDMSKATGGEIGNAPDVIPSVAKMSMDIQSIEKAINEKRDNPEIKTALKEAMEESEVERLKTSMLTDDTKEVPKQVVNNYNTSNNVNVESPGRDFPYTGRDIRSIDLMGGDY